MNPLVKLRDLMNDAFQEPELNALCFEMGIDYENLEGTIRLIKVQSLIIYCKQHGRLPELVQLCRRLRPNIHWPDTGALQAAEEPVEFNNPQVIANGSSQQKKGNTLRLGLIGLGFLGLCVIVIAGIFVYQQLFSQNKAEVSTRITDENGASVHGASVLFFFEGGTLQEYTDSNGFVGVDISYEEENTDVRLVVEANGYKIFERQITVPETQVIQVRLETADPESGDVIVWVTDNKGNAVQNAQVLLLVNTDPFSQITDSNGITKFPLNFENGRVEGQISVQMENFEANTQRLTLLANRVQEIQIDSGSDTAEAVREFPEPENPTPSQTSTSNGRTEPKNRSCANEPDDTLFSFGEYVNCTIHVVGDSDVFIFSGNEGDVILLQGVSHDGVRPCLEIFYPDGTSEIACFTSSVNRLDLELNQSGDFRSLIRDSSNNATGEYNLFLQRLFPIPNYSVELEFRETFIHELSIIGGFNQFHFSGTEDDRVRIQGTSSGGIRPCLELISPDNSRKEACFTSSNNVIDTILTQTGTFVLLVRDSGNNAVGEYSITIQCISGSC